MGQLVKFAQRIMWKFWYYVPSTDSPLKLFYLNSYLLTFWLCLHWVGSTEGTYANCGGRNIKVVIVVRMQATEVKCPVNHGESPLSSSVSLDDIHSVVPNKSIDLFWWWWRPPQHDHWWAEGWTAQILRRSRGNYAEVQKCYHNYKGLRN